MSSYQKLISQREVLNKQIEVAKAVELNAVVSDIKRKMLDYGITCADLGIFPHRINKPRPRRRVEPKYYNPAQPDQKWSGRGKAPKWIVGQNRSDFLIQKDQGFQKEA